MGRWARRYRAHGGCGLGRLGCRSPAPASVRSAQGWDLRTINGRFGLTLTVADGYRRMAALTSHISAVLVAR